MDKVATGERITATQAQLDQPLHERPNTGTWFITGTSSGLGRALVAAVLERGDNVVATARQPDAVADLAGLYPERALLVRLDVTDRAEVEAAVAQALERFGRIDVVVNNAGYGVLGPSRRRRTSKPTRSSKPISLERSMSRAVLPALRQQRAGHFLQISSIGGQIAFPGLGIYNATKFGLEAISQALAGELAPHGIIKVTIVEPGGMRTDWAGRSMAYTEPRETYTETVGPLRQMLRQAAGSAVNSGLSDPRRVATALIAVVESDDPPLRLPLGSDALEGIRRKLAHQQAELDRWAELSRSTDFTAASRTGTTSRRRACEAAS